MVTHKELFEKTVKLPYIPNQLPTPNKKVTDIKIKKRKPLKHTPFKEAVLQELIKGYKTKEELDELYPDINERCGKLSKGQIYNWAKSNTGLHEDIELCEKVHNKILKEAKG